MWDFGLSIFVFAFGFWMFSLSLGYLRALVRGRIRSSRDLGGYTSARENKVVAFIGIFMCPLYGTMAVLAALAMSGSNFVMSLILGLGLFIAIRQRIG